MGCDKYAARHYVLQLIPPGKPGAGASRKLQAKQASSAKLLKVQAASFKRRAASLKLQAASGKL
jgi:hypothetical protein